MNGNSPRIPDTSRSNSTASLRAGLALVLAAGTLAVFLSAIGFELLHFDDRRYLVTNAWIAQGLSLDTLRHAFEFHFSNWHPLTWVSWALDVELFGGSPAGVHATSVALHLVNSLLMFALLERTTGAAWPSAGAAALNLGNRLLERGIEREAISHYEDALRRRPGWGTPALGLAWLLATTADPALRDPPRALALAEVALADTDETSRTRSTRWQRHRRLRVTTTPPPRPPCARSGAQWNPANAFARARSTSAGAGTCVACPTSSRAPPARSRTAACGSDPARRRWRARCGRDRAAPPAPAPGAARRRSR